MARALFCMVSDDLSGGTKVLREIMRLMSQDGYDIDVYYWDRRRGFQGWPELPVAVVENFHDLQRRNYKFVFASNLFLFPVVLPWSGAAIPVLICMAYESFHYGSSFNDAMEECPAARKIMQLPRAIIAVSHALQQLLKTRAGLDSFFIPHGLDRALFYPRPPAPPANRKRILMVGSYLSCWKGMADGCAALEILSKEMDVELVLITQATSGRSRFAQFTFPIEFHVLPPLDSIPEIYASCHVYCCPSWHEGFGLPVIEAFSCGVPVVSTRNHGVSDHGIDEVNLLLAEPDNPLDLAEKLKRMLTEQHLAQRLRERAFAAVEPYDWENTRQALRESLREIEQLEPFVTTYDRASMDALLVELESDGAYTPISVYADMRMLLGELYDVCKRLAKGTIEPATGIERITALRDALGQYLQNPRAQYFQAFYVPFNLCRLLIAFDDDGDSIQRAAQSYCLQFSEVTTGDTEVYAEIRGGVSDSSCDPIA